MKKNTGIRRVIRAMSYSLAGLKAAFRSEAAFRQEIAVAALLLPLAFWLDLVMTDRLLLIGSVLLVLIVELLNSAIEAVIDRIGPDWHELAGRAKDMGSAAVLISLLFATLCWLTIPWPR
ncbi:diacylglycerol kinase [Desulfuromonas thiophila]|jgi:diacylglycerol kinase (ATP)|uniref:Diacylglycerol kinase n=1 Tax=Desulfuromonas thiophila TaxID=57664 RepID=A0A1G6WRE6_9BACT|nr:diacylglycerol kinase [Desulfuromonas thiophila]MCB5285985.1 diacylglycerol kinase [Candidatus Cloacimonadota bacterium]MCK9172426.1 diacylglycerol kinase [Desulfuromonas thiophila]MDY0368023.1 diacylglycerol kinase [Candidatus Syntrophosphaera sp.]SDD68452.1 diacylglycerol kinase (ATP) [Desulfuromonas thiophila]